MTRTRNIPIRFNEDVIEEMEQAAMAIGLPNRSDFVKFATVALLRYFRLHPEEARGPDFRIVLETLRRQWDTRFASKADDPAQDQLARQIAADVRADYGTKSKTRRARK